MGDPIVTWLSATAYRTSPTVAPRTSRGEVEYFEFMNGSLKGEGLLLARGGRWPIKIEASPAEHRLATTNPRELLDLVGVSSNEMGSRVSGSSRSANGVSSAVARPG